MGLLANRELCEMKTEVKDGVVIICYLYSSMFEMNIQSLFHSKPLIFLSSVESTLEILKEQYESCRIIHWPIHFFEF